MLHCTQAQAGRTLPSARKLLDEGYYVDHPYGPIDYHPYGPLYYSFPFDEASTSYCTKTLCILHGMERNIPFFALLARLFTWFLLDAFQTA